jgi:hypothetical protein
MFITRASVRSKLNEQLLSILGVKTVYNYGHRTRVAVTFPFLIAFGSYPWSVELELRLHDN